MARIPVSEIPNAPGLVGPPASVKYPGAPNVQFANQPYQTGRVAPMQTIANFTKDIAGLQQAPLPSGFAEGQARVVSALGTTAYYAGDATREFGRQVSTAVNAVGSVLNDAHQKALQSKDAVDGIRFQEAMSNIKPAFEKDMLDRKIPVEQWPEYWQKEWAPKFLEQASTYGVTRGTREQIIARATGFVEGQTMALGLNVAKTSMKDDAEFAIGSTDRLMKDNKFGPARLANDTALGQHYITKEQHAQKAWEIDNAESNHLAETAMTYNAPEVLKETDKMIADPKYKSKELDFLRDDLVKLRQVNAAAQARVNNNLVDANQQFLDDVATGKVKPADIKKEGEKRGLHASYVAQVAAQAGKPDPPYDEKIVSDASTRIAKYDPRATYPGSKTPDLTSMQEYHAIKSDLLNLPKVERERLDKELEATWDKARNGEKKTPMEARRGDYYQDVDRLANSGLLGPTGTSAKPGEKGKVVDVAAQATLFKKVTAIQNGIDDLLEKAKADPGKWTVPKFDEEYRKLLTPYMSKEAAEAYYKNAIPPVPAEEEKARAAPVPRIIHGQYVFPGAKPTPAPTPPTAAPPISNVGPRTLRETPAFSAAWDKFGRSDQPQQTVTAYVPGMGGIEGGKGVAGRAGKAFTMEEYQAGTAPHVSVAMDENSEWQGKYLISPSYPGVVFKVEDTGDAFKGKAEQAIDIAFQDKSKATNYSKTATFAPIDEATAQQMAGVGGEKKVGAATMPAVTIPGMQVQDGIDANAPYMSKPRDVGNITRIIMHGDVNQDADALLKYGRHPDPSRKNITYGYHFYIAKDGTVIQGAPIDRVTNHTLGENRDSIGIIIAGADNGKMPTPAQERAAEILVSSLGRALGIPNQNVIGHGELQPHRRDRREGGDVAAIIRSRGYLNVPPAAI